MAVFLKLTKGVVFVALLFALLAGNAGYERAAQAGSPGQERKLSRSRSEAETTYFNSFGWADAELSPPLLELRGLLGDNSADPRDKREMGNKLLRCGLEGDLFALAVLSVLEQRDPNFTYNFRGIGGLLSEWLVESLGAGEGNWLLAVANEYWLRFEAEELRVLSVSDRTAGEINAAEQSVKHMKAGALAGNHKCFFAAAAHLGRSGIKPQEPPLRPVPSEISKNDPVMYAWMAKAAENGSAAAATFIAWDCVDGKLPERTLRERSEEFVHYSRLAAMNGSPQDAGALGRLYEIGEFRNDGNRIVVSRNPEKAVLYGMLAARLENGGGYKADGKLSRREEQVEERAERFLAGKSAGGLRLSRAEYDGALLKSKKMHDDYHACETARKAAEKAHYSKASERLPRLMESLEAKYGKERLRAFELYGK